MRFKGKDFDKQMEEWGLDPVPASEFLGKDERSVRRWRRSNDFPDAVVMLIKVMAENKLTPADVCQLAGRKVKGITE